MFLIILNVSRYYKLTFTNSMSNIETLEKVKYVQSKQKKQQNDVVLVFQLLTL